MKRVRNEWWWRTKLQKIKHWYQCIVEAVCCGVCGVLLWGPSYKKLGVVVGVDIVEMGGGKNVDTLSPWGAKWAKNFLWWRVSYGDWYIRGGLKLSVMGSISSGRVVNAEMWGWVFVVWEIVSAPINAKWTPWGLKPRALCKTDICQIIWGGGLGENG